MKRNPKLEREVVRASDFSWLETTPIWKNASNILRREFIEYMTERSYGQTETLDAFHHFYAGWNAQNTRARLAKLRERG